jgi:hypothetical protein
MTMLYFVVRADVTKGDGAQRVFGCFDTSAEAARFIVNDLGHLKGVFKVFCGKELKAELKGKTT